jgi:hypothetical protein
MIAARRSCSFTSADRSSNAGMVIIPPRETGLQRAPEASEWMLTWNDRLKRPVAQALSTGHEVSPVWLWLSVPHACPAAARLPS